MGNITWVGMTRQHFQRGSAERIRAVVIHATAGRGPGDLGWLRKGGDERRPISCHYYIDKAGRISQLVKDEDIAWHAGVSRWMIDGQMRDNLNTVSVGIELENLNTGRDPYPEAQIAATVALTRMLVERYNVPRTQLVRHLDISPGRKTDPAGFPWQTFVARVYANSDTSNATPQDQVRNLMLDLAYRAAGTGIAADWPLFAAARHQSLGLPVAVITARPTGQSGGTAQDDRDRAVRLPGQAPLLIEAYARDLIYAEANGPDDEPPAQQQTKRLQQTPAGPLRDALLDLLFRSADPLHGFKSAWAFHQTYLKQPARLGVPIGANHRLTINGRQAFTCQHFSLDSLCSPADDWQTVYRLSEMNRTLTGLDAATTSTLRRTLLDDLYRSRTGRRYDAEALLIRQAERRRLGAPLGRPEVVMVQTEAYLLMPFALDILACQLPSVDWPLDKALPNETKVIGLNNNAARVGGLTGILLGGHPDHPLTRLRQRVHLGLSWNQHEPEEPAALLGSPAAQPIIFDMGTSLHQHQQRTRPQTDTILITATTGPVGNDLYHEAAAGRWHYYIDATGAIYRLCDEACVATAAPDTALGERSIVIAVEGGPSDADTIQRRALSWLVRSLSATLQIPSERIRVLRNAGYAKEYVHG